MTGTKWDREVAAAQLRPKLWRYLSAAARVTRSSFGATEVLLDRKDLVRILATHLALAETTHVALDSAQKLLDQMPSSAATQRVELIGEIRGQVHWQSTYARRLAAGDPTLFVCSPPERRYDTPLGRLIHLALRCIAQLAGLTGLSSSGEVGAKVHETSDRARRLLLHPKLSKVREVHASSIRHMDLLVSRRPLAKDLVDIIDRYVSGILNGDVSRLRELLEQQFLAPAEESRLFELQVGFDILEALEDFGFVVDPPLPLLPGGSVPFARFRSGDNGGVVYWQNSAWVLDPKANKSGIWWKVLNANGMPQQPLRPDFVVDLTAVNRRFLVEVKLTGSIDHSPDRDGIRDALAYLHDAEELFSDVQPPHALVVAWNSAAVPQQTSVIRVASQDTLRDSIASILHTPTG